MKRKLKKGMSFHTEDDTILDCPTAKYDYNWGIYNKFKIWLLICSIVGIVVSILLLCFIKNSIVQTVSSTFLGGLLGIVIWLITIFVTDKINKEQAEIDRLLYEVDRFLRLIHENIILDDMENYEHITTNSIPNGIYYRFLWLIQNCVFMSGSKSIDFSNLKLSWENKEYCIKEYIYLCENLITEHKLVLDELHQKMVEWNFNKIERELCTLRDKLHRYKTYIYDYHPPVQFNQLKNK